MTGDKYKMEEKTKEIQGFDNYITSFLKSEDIENDNEYLPVINIAEIERDGKKQIRLILQKNGFDYAFDLNITNTLNLKTELKNAEKNHPKDVVGMLMSFRKVLVNNPNTGKEVESLRIKDIKPEVGEETVE